MSKRVFSIILILVCAFVMFSGCDLPAKTGTEDTSATPQQTTGGEAVTEQKEDFGDTGGLELPLSDKVVTVTAFAQSDAASLSDKWVFDELERRTNVRVEITPIATSGYGDKLKVMIASGNMTDIAPVGWMNISDINKAGTKGEIVAINEYTDMLPNFKNFVEKYPFVMQSFTAEDGNLYFWPTHENNRDVNHGMLYRKDIFDKHGIKAWTNTEEFYDALVQLKGLYPDKYPFASKNTEGIFRTISPGWGFQPYQWPVYYDYASNTWKNAVTDPNFKDMLTFMQKLNREGLLDPEFLTDTTASWTQKMTTDAAFVTYDWIGRMEMFYGQLKDTYPEYDLRYAYPIGPTGENQYISKVSQCGHTVLNNDKKEIVLKLIDYMTSPSGTELMTMGMEGETYTKTEEGKYNYIGFDEGAVIGIKDLEDKFGLFIQPTMYTRMDPRSVYFTYSEREQEAQDMLLQSDRIQKQEPILIFTEEESGIISSLKPELIKSLEEFASKFVLDLKMGDADWDEWVQEIEKRGEVQRLVDICNAAQVRLDSK